MTPSQQIIVCLAVALCGYVVGMVIREFIIRQNK